jgi:hypothetical protein
MRRRDGGGYIVKRGERIKETRQGVKDRWLRLRLRCGRDGRRMEVEEGAMGGMGQRCSRHIDGLRGWE